jgi:hypothetical protein
MIQQIFFEYDHLECFNNNPTDTFVNYLTWNILNNDLEGLFEY